MKSSGREAINPNKNMIKKSYEMEIRVNGRPVKEYSHKGNIFIEGKKGSEYSIRLKNNSPERKLFVITVDGLSVMNGERGSFDSGGYIVNGYDSITIDGWRTSNEEVAKFYFSDSSDSYANQIDRGENIGVVGCLVFSERFDSIPARLYWDCANTCQNNFDRYQNNPIDIMSGNSEVNNNSLSSMYNYSYSTQDLGTGFGETKHSSVITVDFERENNPEVEFAVYYNTREALEKMGIDFISKPQYVIPNAFPDRYCKPPKKRSYNR